MPALTHSVWLLWVLTLPAPIGTPGLSERLRGAPDPVIKTAASAQLRTPAPKRGREIFFSWGYNGNHYTQSDLHIEQESIGNDFTFVGVKARDSKPWGNILGHSLFVPQYNVRGGIFFNETWGLEVALDHMKWIVRQDQAVPITGTLNGVSASSQVTLTENVLRYQLNNGANPVFVNAVRRVRLRGERGKRGFVAFLAKAGGGLAFPHTENTLFGQPNEKGFQFFHGWNMDIAAALRVHVFKRLYLEGEDKLVYVRYFGVKVDRGTAAHSIKANEFVVSLGMSFR